MSQNRIDEYLYSVEALLMKKHGVDQARRYMYPLCWYINTERASACFLRLLFDADPSVICKALEAGGSDEAVINRICKRLKYTRE